MFFAIQQQPELVHSVFAPEQVAEFEQDVPATETGSGAKAAATWHVRALIYNNVSIGFRTFAAAWSPASARAGAAAHG